PEDEVRARISNVDCVRRGRVDFPSCDDKGIARGPRPADHPIRRREVRIARDENRRVCRVRGCQAARESRRSLEALKDQNGKEDRDRDHAQSAASSRDRRIAPSTASHAFATTKAYRDRQGWEGSRPDTRNSEESGRFPGELNAKQR